MNSTTAVRSALAGIAALLLVSVAAGAQAPAIRDSRGSGIDTANFDRTVRPQDDFFRFANGTWLRTTRIPDDRATYGAFVELSDASQVALRQIVEEAASATASPGTIVQLVGDYYASYMDSATVEQRGLSPLRETIDRIVAANDRAGIEALFARFAHERVTTPISVSVTVDARNATRYAAHFSQSGLGLPDRDYYLGSDPGLVEAREAYQRYAQTLLRLADRPDPDGSARRVLALEAEMAERQWSRTRNRDREATNTAFDFEGLQSLAPGFDWPAFLAATGTDGSPTFIVRQPDYLTRVDSLLTRIPIETWQEYLLVRLLDSYASHLGRAFAEAAFTYHGQTLQGLAEERPRWKRGVASTESALGMQLGQLYVDRHFQAAARERMDLLVRNLLDAFREGIDQLEWMSPATRAEAHDKLAHFTVKIGYPDEWPEHEGLSIARGDLVGNLRRAREFQYRTMVNHLGQPIDVHEWAMTPQTVNAYYNSTQNEIVFPAAILQPPFFDPAADDAVNYGAIGAVIGHEISHGFDDQGRRSDGSGTLRDWWTAEDARAFEERADRLAEQYSAFVPLEGMPINGRLTLGENIGDLSGLAVAYQAYRRSLRGTEPAVIDGLTGDQRFFLGWAQIWRTLFREEALRQRLLTDPHSPGEYRVNGVLRNIDAFYRAFDVQPGDGMYLAPENRIKIW